MPCTAGNALSANAHNPLPICLPNSIGRIFETSMLNIRKKGIESKVLVRRFPNLLCLAGISPNPNGGAMTPQPKSIAGEVRILIEDG